MKTKFLTILLTLLPLTLSAIEIQSSIGKGLLQYDQEAGLKDRCIEVVKAADVYKEDVKSTVFSLHLIKNKEELHEKITSSSSGKGSYGVFNAGAKASFVREVNWNFNSNYILVKATRTTYRESLANDRMLLTKSARNLLLDSKFKFLESCGSSFAEKIDYGGEIYGIIEIRSSTYEEKKKIEMSLEASGKYSLGKASGSADYKHTIQKITSEYDSKVEFRHIGGRQVEVPTDVNGLLEMSTKIEEITDSNPVPVSIETRDYSTLANFEHDDINYETRVRQDNIDFATNKLQDARTLYANILTVLEYPEKFKKFNPQYLYQKLNYLDSKILELKDFIYKSYSFLNEVDVTKLNVDLNIQLPQKIKVRSSILSKKEEVKIPVNCELKRSPICGVEKYKQMKSSACNVAGVNTGNGPSCGTIYVTKASEFCGVLNYKQKSDPACGVAAYNQCHTSSCGKNWDGSRKRCRHPSCGVEAYKTCRDKSFGVETYNTCSHPQHGVQEFLTCQHKDFGYNFESCEHLSHGPDTYKACEVAKIGDQTTYCPSL